MGFTVELLPDEPILIATAQGKLTIQDFADLFATTRELLAGLEGTFYRISDFRDASSSFMDLIHMSQLASKGSEGTTTDPRIKAVLVGTNQWVRLGRTIMEQPQYSALQLPTLENVEDALVYVRRELQAAHSPFHD